MNLVFRTRLFSSELLNKEERGYIGKGAAIGAGLGAGAGAGLGYVGGRLAGKIFTPNKEVFIEKYQKQNPKSTKKEAEEVYQKRRAKFNKIGTVVGGAAGALSGALHGSFIGGAGAMMKSAKRQHDDFVKDSKRRSEEFFNKHSNKHSYGGGFSSRPTSSLTSYPF